MSDSQHPDPAARLRLREAIEVIDDLRAALLPLVQEAATEYAREARVALHRAARFLNRIPEDLHP